MVELKLPDVERLNILVQSEFISDGDSRELGVFSVLPERWFH